MNGALPLRFLWNTRLSGLIGRLCPDGHCRGLGAGSSAGAHRHPSPGANVLLHVPMGVLAASAANEVVEGGVQLCRQDGPTKESKPLSLVQTPTS